MIRCYKTIEEMNHPWADYDDDEIYMTKDELQKAKKRIRIPKERAWELDSKLTALRDN